MKFAILTVGPDDVYEMKTIKEYSLIGGNLIIELDEKYHDTSLDMQKIGSTNLIAVVHLDNKDNVTRIFEFVIKSIGVDQQAKKTKSSTSGSLTLRGAVSIDEVAQHLNASIMIVEPGMRLSDVIAREMQRIKVAQILNEQINAARNPQPQAEPVDIAVTANNDQDEVQAMNTVEHQLDEREPKVVENSLMPNGDTEEIHPNATKPDELAPIDKEENEAVVVHPEAETKDRTKEIEEISGEPVPVFENDEDQH